jgi:hypothetical protein
MALVEKVKEVVVRLESGEEVVLKPSSVSRIPTRTEGEPLHKQGSITYWHIIAMER